MADDGGVLGNLPNSRPGKRSAKRDAGAGRPSKAAGRPSKAADAAAAKAEASGKPAAKPAKTPRAARTSAKPGRAAAGAGTKPKGSKPQPEVAASRPPVGGERRPPLQPDSVGAPADPVTAAVRTAAGIAVTGARVAGAVTQEILRRLPRP